MIEVKNLVKRYGNHTAVDDLSFTVETGKVVGFLGPNGAGKSTTMNMITGYLAPNSGKILIDGIDIMEEPEMAKSKIGYLQFVAELKKVAKKDRDMAVFQVMKKTMTTDVSERLIRHLSKGYKQRVGLAGAMVGQPDILILDEPTVGLDPGQIIEIRELIRELSKEHTVLLSSHIMQEISAVCDEIIIINQGKMIVCDTPENLTKKMVESKGIYLQIKGPKEKILDTLRSIDGIENIEIDETKESKEKVKAENNQNITVENEAELTAGESSENDIVSMTVHSKDDVRERVFYAMSELLCPILEMRSLHTTLEDAFLALTENSPSAPKKEEKTEQQDEAEEETEIDTEQTNQTEAEDVTAESETEAGEREDE